MRISSIAPFAVSAALSRACGRWRRASARSARRFGYANDAAGVTNKLHRFTYDDYLCISRNREVDAQHGIGTDDFVWDPTEPIATRPLMCDLSYMF